MAGARRSRPFVLPPMRYAAPMRSTVLLARAILVALAVTLAGSTAARAAGEVAAPGPRAVEIPKWFAQSFLDFRDEVREAARQGKRVMVYFGQEGCPYCKALMQVDFGDPQIVATTRREFVAIALDLWGDRETTWIDGRQRSEKELARSLGIQYTPTLLFLDEKGGVRLRLNGYHPPESFRIALDYAAGRGGAQQSFTEYLASRTGRKGAAGAADASATAADLPRLLREGRPVLVLYGYDGCRDCEAMRREGFARPEVKRLLERFTVVPLDLAGRRKVVTPAGEVVEERRWARSLEVVYAPTLLFLDGAGGEAFRSEGYLKPFHLAATLDYVASGAYRKEPSFQRYLQRRAEAMRAQSKPVDLW